ncbi:exopolysaccharide biosynthesis protein [Azospirillum sp. B21]|uniref:exopolysaccharide biosynthesis protein n=1 Tax=Azospirillum sp. B21 TaxID=2607496 RepID=UPI0011EC66B3|nr:exopolysaccharide biosynthesis protein [Azospirillum sp. B21]KAA0583219.1 exopolysaccharide biosynthesis protein [Azospirillum sp. B21]
MNARRHIDDADSGTFESEALERDAQPDGAIALPAACAEVEEERTSDVLARFRANLPPGRVTLGDLIRALGDRSLGTILLALSLPTIAPVPLGVSCLFDLPIVLYTAQLAFGRRGAGLPDWLLRRSIGTGLAARTLDAAMPRLVWIERMLKPRLHRLARIDQERWFGLLLFILTLTCIIPLPLTGWLPGFALVLISLGLIERDGGAIGVGLGLTVGALVFLTLVASSLSYAGHQLLAATL